MDQESARTGVPIYRLVQMAWNTYRRNHAVDGDNPLDLGPVTPKERSLAESVIAMYREHDIRITFIQNYVADWLFWKKKRGK